MSDTQWVLIIWSDSETINEMFGPFASEEVAYEFVEDNPEIKEQEWSAQRVLAKFTPPTRYLMVGPNNHRIILGMNMAAAHTAACIVTDASPNLNFTYYRERFGTETKCRLEDWALDK